MEGNSPYITNLVNSIIGVSVLAMPYCLKQCGIILGLGLLFSAAWLTYLSCSMLASSAYQKRRRSYEYLALFTLGPTGKFAVELSMIGLMLGTCIAFYVVIGDLSYGTVAKFVPGADPATLRMYTIIFTALCIALPLGNMKNLSVLSYFGFFSLLFYLAFLVVVIFNAVSNGLLNWEWMKNVNYWRPAGIFQCLPIFSLAYACQCQLFIVYSSLEEPTVHRVEDIVMGAIRFVTVAYMSIGFFGYTTYQEAIAGNLLLNFPSNLLLDFIKMGFAMSVVLGFPLMISPCRQSIHTLLFAQPAGEGMQTTTYIPPFLFKSITLGIVTFTMFIAIVIPNVETILGLTGATMGSMICFIFPALIYEKAHTKASSNTPKFVFVLGCILLVVCTYSNLNKITDPPPIESVPQVPDPPQIDLGLDKMEGNEAVVANEGPKDSEKNLAPNDKEDLEKPNIVAEVEGPDHRHEPPNPIEPDNPVAVNKEDSPVDQNAKDVEGNKPVVDSKDAEIKQDSPKDEAHIAHPQEDNVKIETPAKQEDAGKKEDSVGVEKSNLPPQDEEKPKIPVPDKIQSPPKHVEEHKSEDQKDVRVANPKQPVESQRSNEPTVHKEAPKVSVILSPKIVKKDEVAQPLAGSQVKGDVVAQPGLQQGSPVKEEHAMKNENLQKSAPLADSAQKEAKGGDDTANEKELLEKIKEQHDMQQQLLIEQEQLIKKLEEHQDKKDQAGEEDGEGGGRLEQDARQEPSHQQHQEVAQQPDPSRIEKEESHVDGPKPQIPEIVNKDSPQKNDVRQPQGDISENVGQSDDRSQDVVKQEVKRVDVPRQAGNKVIAGRELLSQDNVLNPLEDQANENEDRSDPLEADKSQDHMIPGRFSIGDKTNLALHHNGHQGFHAENTQHRFAHPRVDNRPFGQRFRHEDVKVPLSRGMDAVHVAMPMSERVFQRQQDKRSEDRKNQDESNDGAPRKIRDVDSQLVDAEGPQRSVEALKDDGDVMNERSMIKSNHETQDDGIGAGNGEMTGKDERSEINEDQMRGQTPLVSPVLSKQLENRDMQATVMESALHNDNIDARNGAAEKRDWKRVGVVCLENDLECWQSKSKLRDLKSLDHD